jgi:hypothetical protein
MIDGIGHVKIEHIQVKYVRLGKIQHVEMLMERQWDLCRHE